MDWNERVQQEIDVLRTVRDELRVKAHLGAADARSEWERLEKSWHHLEGRLKVLRDASKESLDDVGEAARLLVDEIRDGYHELRKLI